MPRNQLKNSIKHLQEELADGEPLSKEERAQLESVLGQVAALLEREGAEVEAPSESDAGVFGELPSLVERFESTHPKLAVVLGRIADSLSQLGI